MKVAVIQPGYLPWLGYFEQMHQADIFVHATNLRYTRQDWRNRNRIKTKQGWQWLTVPVKSRGNFNVAINEIRINNDVPWAKKHLNIIKENYKMAPYYQDYIAFFEESYRQVWNYLIDLDLHFINYFKDVLGIRTGVLDIDDLNLGEVNKNTRLIKVCRQLGASIYLSGAAAKDYIKQELFDEAGIELQFQEYIHPVYPQLHGDFISHLSIIDLLFNCGEKSLSILSSA